MLLNVKVIPRASKNQIKDQVQPLRAGADQPSVMAGCEGDTQYRVYLTAAPIDGKANDALIEILASHFHIAKQQIKIVRGLKSKHKIVEII